MVLHIQLMNVVVSSASVTLRQMVVKMPFESLCLLRFMRYTTRDCEYDDGAVEGHLTAELCSCLQHVAFA